MAEAIYLNKEEADRCVDVIKRQVEVLGESAKEIDKTMEDLRNHWKGSSANKTQANYEDNYKNMLTQSIPDAVSELQKFVEDCTQAIFETDQQL